MGFLMPSGPSAPPAPPAPPPAAAPATLANPSVVATAASRRAKAVAGAGMAAGINPDTGMPRATTALLGPS